MATVATKLRGTVKSLKRQEGYGFISHTVTGDDYFFHRSTLENPSTDWEEVEQDDMVEFMAVDSPKGLRAAQVRILR